jgi:hypothetical protein
MKSLLPSIIICFGLIFLGLTQRYDYVGQDGRYRVDKLTGQKEWCEVKSKKESGYKTFCYVEVKGKGIFEILFGTDYKYEY